MVTINNIEPKDNGSQIDYTINFGNSSNNLSGVTFASEDDLNNALKNSVSGDYFGGLKLFVLKQIHDDSELALNNK